MPAEDQGITACRPDHSPPYSLHRGRARRHWRPPDRPCRGLIPNSQDAETALSPRATRPHGHHGGQSHPQEEALMQGAGRHPAPGGVSLTVCPAQGPGQGHEPPEGPTEGWGPHLPRGVLAPVPQSLQPVATPILSTAGHCPLGPRLARREASGQGWQGSGGATPRCQVNAARASLGTGTLFPGKAFSRGPPTVPRPGRGASRTPAWVWDLDQPTGQSTAETRSDQAHKGYP